MVDVGNVVILEGLNIEGWDVVRGVDDDMEGLKVDIAKKF